MAKPPEDFPIDDGPQDLNPGVTAEETQHDGAERFRLMVEGSESVFFYTHGRDHCFDYLSPSTLNVIGYEPKELIGQPYEQLLIPGDLENDQVPEITEKAMREGLHPPTYLASVNHKDGHRVVLEIQESPISRDGAVVGIQGFARNISERMAASEAMEKSETRFSTLFYQAAVGMCLVSKDGRFIRANERFCEMVGYTIEELLQRDCIETTHPDDREAEKENISRMLAGESQTMSWDKRYLHKNGKIVWCHLTFSLTPDRKDEERQFMGVIEDISSRREAEDMLLRSQTLQRIAGRMALLGGWSLDLPENKITLSDEACMLHDLPVGYDMKLDNAIAFYAPEYRDVIAENVRRLATEGTPYDCELELITAKNRRIWVRTMGEAKRDSNGKIFQLNGTFQDISKSKKAEEILIQNQAMLRMAGRVAHLGAWTIELPGYELTWSDEIAIIFDLEPGQTPTFERAIEYFPPEHRSAMMAQVDTLVADGTPFDSEFELITAKNRRIWVRVIAEAHRDDTGKIFRLSGAFQDITKSKESDLALIAGNRALQLLSRCSETLIRSKNEDDLLNDICSIAVEVGGFSMAWVGYVQDDAGKTIKTQTSFGNSQEYLVDLEISAEEDGSNGQSPAGRVIRSGEPLIIPDLSSDPNYEPWLEKARTHGFSGKYVLPLKDERRTFGVLVLYTDEVRPMPHADEMHLLSELADDLAYGICSLRSEIGRRRMEAAMQKMAVSVSASSSRNFFFQLVTSMSDALSADGAFMSVRVPGESARAKIIAGVVDGRQQSNFEYNIHESPCDGLLDGEDCIIPSRLPELYPQCPAVETIKGQAYAGRAVTNSESETVGFLFLIFRKPLESSEFLSSALQIFSNRAAAELSRRQSDARLREQASLLDKARDAILVRDMDHTIRYCNESAKKLYGWADDEACGSSALDLIYRDTEHYMTALEATLTSGEWNGELEQFTKSGDKITVEARWTLVTDEKGNPTSILSISSDITERKKLEQQFLRAQRMESIGTLAGGIAHDLNNVLAPIMMSLEMLKSEETDEEKTGILEVLETSAQRGADMVKQVLSFARGMEGQKLEVKVENLLKEIKKLADETFLKNITVECDIPTHLWTVLGDSSQLHQVLLNLCVNARDAMPEGGKISLAAKNMTIDEHYAAMNHEAKPGPYLCIQVEDNGTGMPPDVLDKIFDPFFTTKGPGKGTGLGLSTTIGIIKGHGGFLRAYSEVGVGTRFNIYIPAQKEAVPDSAAEPEDLDTQSLRGDGQLILVIDDEMSIRKITKQTLEGFGYRVVLASDGAEATAIYGVRRHEIDAVLTDMMMPIMDGPATIQVLMRINPEVRIIAASGLNVNGMVARAAHDGVKHFLPKPYTAETLLKTLREVLHD